MSDVCIMSIFFPFVDWHLTVSGLSMNKHKFLILVQLNLFFLILWLLFIVSCFRNICLFQDKVTLLFIIKRFIVLPFIFRSVPLCSQFLCRVGSQDVLFSSGLYLIPYHLFRRISFLQCNKLCLYHKSDDYINTMC